MKSFVLKTKGWKSTERNVRAELVPENLLSLKNAWSRRDVESNRRRMTVHVMIEP